MASRFADEHDVVLVGYRGMDSSVRLDCPEVESALEALDGSPREKSLTAYADGFRGMRGAADGRGRRSRRLQLSAAGRRPRSGARRARLRPHRPRQRERWDAHGDDLRLALSREHPPLGDDRGQSARPLRLGREDDRRADRALRRALLAGRELQRPDRRTWPRRWRRRRDPGRLVLPADRAGHHARRLLLLARGDDLRERAAVGSDGRSTPGSPRSTATPAASGSRLSSPIAFFPGEFVWGEYAAAAPTRRTAGEGLLLAPERLSIRTSRDAATAFGWGGGRLIDAWPAPPDEDEYSRGADLERGDAPHRRRARRRDSAAVGDARAAAVPAERRRRSCCRGSGTRRASGSTSRKPAPG